MQSRSVTPYPLLSLLAFVTHKLPTNGYLDPVFQTTQYGADGMAVFGGAGLDRFCIIAVRIQQGRDRIWGGRRSSRMTRKPQSWRE